MDNLDLLNERRRRRKLAAVSSVVVMSAYINIFVRHFFRRRCEVMTRSLKSHSDAAPFQTKSFPQFDELTTLYYAKDKATGRDSQSVHEVLVQAETEDSSYHEEANFEHQPQGSVSSSGKKRKRKESDDKLAIEELGKHVKELGDKITRSLTMDIVQEYMLQVNAALSALEGITREEKIKANRLFAKDGNLVLLFFGCEEHERLEWLRGMLD